MNLYFSSLRLLLTFPIPLISAIVLTQYCLFYLCSNLLLCSKMYCCYVVICKFGILLPGHVAYHVMCCFLVVFQLTRSSRHFTLAGSCLVSLLQSQIGSGRICGWYRIYVYVRGNAN